MRRQSQRKHNKSSPEYLDQQVFAAHLEAITRQAGLDLYIILHGEAVRCKLNSAYQLSPRRLDDIIHTHLHTLGHVSPTSLPPTDEKITHSLLPMLNSTQWLNDVEQRRGIPPVHRRPFVAGLKETI